MTRERQTKTSPRRNHRQETSQRNQEPSSGLVQSYFALGKRTSDIHPLRRLSHHLLSSRTVRLSPTATMSRFFKKLSTLPSHDTTWRKITPENHREVREPRPPSSNSLSPQGWISSRYEQKDRSRRHQRNTHKDEHNLKPPMDYTSNSQFDFTGARVDIDNISGQMKQKGALYGCPRGAL